MMFKKLFKKHKDIKRTTCKVKKKKKNLKPKKVPGLPFIPAVILGCKCDMIDKKSVKTEEGLEFAAEMLFPETDPDLKVLEGTEYFLETSAKGIPSKFSF